MNDSHRQELSGNATVLIIALGVLLLAGVGLLGFVSASRPETGSTGRAGLVEINPDGSRGRVYLWVWPWENPDKLGADPRR